MFHETEPFSGWLAYYDSTDDEYGPFFGVEANHADYERFIYTFPAHPNWDDIGSESLLVKVLYADYEEGYAIIELFGEWNDIHLNDFKLLAENVFTYLLDYYVNKIILICENVFHIYLDTDDYYQELQEELEEGWVCVIRTREEVQQEMERYGIDRFLYRNAQLDQLKWRKLNPWELFQVVDASISRLLPK